MMTSANSDTELLTEHFGYPPVSLIDDIINSINILAERALNSVEQGLLNAPPSSIGFKPSRTSRKDANREEAQLDPAEAAKTEIESGTHQLETLLCASIDRNFDKFEIYVLRNILCVRPADVRNWMRLSHYDGLDFSSLSSSSHSSKSDTPTLESINHLRRKLRESMRLNALLNAERARNEKMLAELQALVGVRESQIKPERSPSQTTTTTSTIAAAQTQPQPKPSSPFAFLHDKGTLTDGGSEAPLSTTTAFALSQMQALRALSTSLERLAPDLLPAPQPPSTVDNVKDEGENDEEGNGDGSGGRKSWRRERLEYVEGATRRYLETVEGLELGRHGEVRDGEWQGDGGDVAEGERGSLERTVTVLGGGDSGRGDPSTASATPSASTSRRARGARASSRDEDRMDES